MGMWMPLWLVFHDWIKFVLPIKHLFVQSCGAGLLWVIVSPAASSDYCREHFWFQTRLIGFCIWALADTSTMDLRYLFVCHLCWQVSCRWKENDGCTVRSDQNCWKEWSQIYGAPDIWKYCPLSWLAWDRLAYNTPNCLTLFAHVWVKIWRERLHIRDNVGNGFPGQSCCFLWSFHVLQRVFMCYSVCCSHPVSELLGEHWKVDDRRMMHTVCTSPLK